MAVEVVNSRRAALRSDGALSCVGVALTSCAVCTGSKHAALATAAVCPHVVDDLNGGCEAGDTGLARQCGSLHAQYLVCAGKQFQ